VTKDQDYGFARTSLVTHKRRKLELTLARPPGAATIATPGAAYNDTQRRNEENQISHGLTPLGSQTSQFNRSADSPQPETELISELWRAGG
jgi:hypothetical protein